MQHYVTWGLLAQLPNQCRQCCEPSCGYTAGKKDTASSEVLAMTHIEGSLPFGINRVASILAGRTRLPVVAASQAPSRGFASLPLHTGNSRIALWRGFAAHAECR